MLVDMLKKVNRWFNQGSIIEEIVEVFSLVTIINSFMMLVGWDQPKTGVFAYIHLLTRLAIISVIIGLWRYKEIIKKLKRCMDQEKNICQFKKGKQIVKVWWDGIPTNKISSIALFFTAITISICLLRIMLHWVIEPLGGIMLYRNLLFLFVIVCALVTLFSLYKERIKKKLS